MKNLLQMTLIFALCSVAFAAVQLTITIPDQYTEQVLAAMNTLAGCHMMLEASEHNNSEDEFDGRWHFRIIPKGGAEWLEEETDKQFAQRFTTELLRASVRLVKSHEENERYRDEVSGIEPPDVNVPDEVIE